MSKFARIENGIVLEVVVLPNGLKPSACFHESVAPEFKAVPANVEAGWLVDGQGFKAPDEPQPDIASVKQALKAKIDTEAETERLKYITPGTGQAMTYQQKVAEAQGYKAATNPKPEDYPILASEVGITAPTLSEVADTVLTAYRQWQQIGAMIEAIRLSAKRDIDASTTEAAARAVMDSVSWPQPTV